MAPVLEVAREALNAQPAVAGDGAPRLTFNIDALVTRFLAWKLPDDFSPDAGISFKRSYNENSSFGPRNHEPTGTNLLTATQARAMLEHVFAAPAEEWTPGPSLWKDWCTRWFGQDADDNYLARAVADLPGATAGDGSGDLPCGHLASLLRRSAETGEPLYCELCDDKSGRRDAEAMEAELRTKLAEAEETIRQLSRALGEEVNGQTFIGEPVVGDAAVELPPLPEPDHSLHSGASPFYSAAQMIAFRVESVAQALKDRDAEAPRPFTGDGAGEFALRELLAEIYAGPESSLLYRDDGELSDGREFPSIDFKRDSAASIRAAMQCRTQALKGRDERLDRAASQP